MANENLVDPASIARQQSEARVKHAFTLPDSARSASDPKVIVLQEITMLEEKLAAKNAEVNKQLAYESLKYSLYSADGVVIPWEKIDSFLGGCSPRCRDLLLKAYLATHYAKDVDTESFLASETQIV